MRERDYIYVHSCMLYNKHCRSQSGNSFYVFTSILWSNIFCENNSQNNKQKVQKENIMLVDNTEWRRILKSKNYNSSSWILRVLRDKSLRLITKIHPWLGIEKMHLPFSSFCVGEHWHHSQVPHFEELDENKFHSLHSTFQTSQQYLIAQAGLSIVLISHP